MSPPRLTYAAGFKDSGLTCTPAKFSRPALTFRTFSDHVVWKLQGSRCIGPGGSPGAHAPRSTDSTFPVPRIRPFGFLLILLQDTLRDCNHPQSFPSRGACRCAWPEKTTTSERRASSPKTGQPLAVEMFFLHFPTFSVSSPLLKPWPFCNHPSTCLINTSTF